MNALTFYRRVYTMKKIICLSTVLLSALTVATGCGKNSKYSDFVGKWQCEELSIGGEKSDSYGGAPAYSLFQIEIGKDNKGRFNSFFVEALKKDKKPVRLKWRGRGTKSIEFMLNTGLDSENDDDDEDDYDMTLTKDGDRLILSNADNYSGDMFYLTKVDEFKPIEDDISFVLNESFKTEQKYDISNGEVRVQITTK
jgi:hypothetical protein